MSTDVVIGLSAVVIAIEAGEVAALTVRPRDRGQTSPLEGLPFGPFDPDGHRTFEIALREFVTRQTRFELGFVEQLYTFGDKGRDAPLADVGAGTARVISVGYLALAPLAVETDAPDTAWSPFFDFFPWEDWRRGRPEIIDDHLAPALIGWAGRSENRLARTRLLFALDGSPWNEERVLDRYELLYEAGLAPEAARDRTRALGGEPAEPPHPGHRPRPAARQAEVPPGDLRADAGGLHPLGAAAHGRGDRRRRPAQAELPPGGGAHRPGRRPRPHGRRHRRPPGRTLPLPPRVVRSAAGIGVVAAIAERMRDMSRRFIAFAVPLALLASDAGPTQAATMQTVTEAPLGVALQIPAGSKVQICHDEARCIEIHGRLRGQPTMLVRLQAFDAPLEDVARNNAGFDVIDGKWVTTYGPSMPMPVETLHTPGWTEMRATVACGVSSTRSGFHAAGGECLWAVLSNGKRSLLATTDDYAHPQSVTAETLHSIRFLP
jgi:ADP-ribose pyrophosphatase YjhB (NUDIX family)